MVLLIAHSPFFKHRFFFICTTFCNFLCVTVWHILYSIVLWVFVLIWDRQPVWRTKSQNFNNMRSCWMLQTTGFHICKQKTIDNCTWNLSLRFIEVRIFCYLMPVIEKNMISWFYAYVEHIEIKTKTVNIIHFPCIDLSQNVTITNNFDDIDIW
jgi:hypothetical protein